MKRWFLIIFSLLLLVTVGVVVKRTFLGVSVIDGQPVAPARIEIVQSISVLSSNEFDIKLANGERIYGKLPVQVSPDAKDKIVRLLHASRNPRAVLRKKVGDTWIVDIVIVNQADEIWLSDWLGKNNWVWK